MGIGQVYRNLFDDGLTLGGVWSAMFFWSLVYMGLSWYIERIFPGEYGVKMPWYFPFMVIYDLDLVTVLEFI
jgi:hypothetical protein